MLLVLYRNNESQRCIFLSCVYRQPCDGPTLL